MFLSERKILAVYRLGWVKSGVQEKVRRLRPLEWMPGTCGRRMTGKKLDAAPPTSCWQTPQETGHGSQRGEGPTCHRGAPGHTALVMRWGALLGLTGRLLHKNTSPRPGDTPSYVSGGKKHKEKGKRSRQMNTFQTEEQGKQIRTEKNEIETKEALGEINEAKSCFLKK